MSSQRGAHGEISGLVVADFADDERLRVLPQKMPRGFRKRQPAHIADFGLHDVRDDLLHRIFHGDDVASARRGEISQAGVNRCRLSAARRTGQQKQSRIPP